MTALQAAEKLIAYARNVQGVPGGTLEQLVLELAPKAVRDELNEARIQEYQRGKEK